MTETNKHGKHGSSGFLFGLIVGFLLAILLTHKKGRQILKELLEGGLNMAEDFVEDKKQEQNFKKSIKVEKQPEVTVDEIIETEEVAEDLNSEVAAVEEVPLSEASFEKMEEASVEEEETKVKEDVVKTKEEKPTHPKKRLFRGIRKK